MWIPVLSRTMSLSCASLRGRPRKSWRPTQCPAKGVFLLPAPPPLALDTLGILQRSTCKAKPGFVIAHHPLPSCRQSIHISSFPLQGHTANGRSHLPQSVRAQRLGNETWAFMRLWFSLAINISPTSVSTPQDLAFLGSGTADRKRKKKTRRWLRNAWYAQAPWASLWMNGRSNSLVLNNFTNQI